MSSVVSSVGVFSSDGIVVTLASFVSSTVVSAVVSAVVSIVVSAVVGTVSSTSLSAQTKVGNEENRIAAAIRLLITFFFVKIISFLHSFLVFFVVNF